jgi:hypothetical protein
MKMPFGKYRGLPLRDLPDDYIDWLHSLDDLHGRLRREVDAEWQYRQLQGESRRPVEHAPDLDAEDRALLAELIRAGYRSVAKKYHPDLGGNPETMVRLNALMERLRQGVLAA